MHGQKNIKKIHDMFQQFKNSNDSNSQNIYINTFTMTFLEFINKTLVPTSKTTESVSYYIGKYSLFVL